MGAMAAKKKKGKATCMSKFQNHIQAIISSGEAITAEFGANPGERELENAQVGSGTRS